jgi:hypothetical protein
MGSRNDESLLLMEKPTPIVLGLVVVKFTSTDQILISYVIAICNRRSLKFSPVNLLRSMPLSFHHHSLSLWFFFEQIHGLIATVRRTGWAVCCRAGIPRRQPPL